MQDQRGAGGNKEGPSDEKFAIAAPTTSLPKGGGAIHGMGEKFAANPVTGTGSMSVPIATSPGRSGFGPQLSLAYDSGAGNGPFGFGWNLSLPSITRKTDKGLPQYLDADESDVFILSGAEDLVPVYRQDAAGAWARDTQGDLIIHEDDIDGYRVRRYRPRIEGLFARIERWTSIADPRDVHWRSISKDNILTLYGSDAESRIFDPEDPSRIFSWLICETRDDKGNGVLYRYKAEDGAGVDLTQAHERNRGPRNDTHRSANRYLKRIFYGNRASLLDNTGHRPRFLNKAQINNQIATSGWMFEIVFDYGDHDTNVPKPNDAGAWLYRSDAFSTYRPGFEVRTTRLCQRVLMFHHFPDEAEVGRDCLVRSTDFTYSHQQAPASARNPIYTFLQAVTQTGYRRNNGGGYDKRSLPPVEFEYTQPTVQDAVHDVDAASLENLPIGVDGTAYQWTDLHGEGIPGILTEQANAWFYKRNLSPIGKQLVEFAPLEYVAAKPNLALSRGAQFMDLAGDGQPDLVVLDGPMPGLYEHDSDEGWQPFHPFASRLNRDMRDPNLKFVDVDGDGHADILITEDDALVWHTSLAEQGFGPAQRVAQALDEENGPRLVFADGTQSIYLGDLSGDGLTDLVRIRNGEICYWPNLGYGRFGAKVTMDNAPHFDYPDLFDHKFIRLADIDGSGTNDIIYLHGDGVRLYFNQSGNGWSAPQVLKVFPRVDDLVNIVPTDLLGNGTACLVWSSPLPGDARRQMRYVDLMGGQKPHLLVKTVNNLGAETVVQYAPSTKFYLQDKRDGKPWVTKLPFPVHVVEKVTVTDKWRKTTFSTTYSYHHGHFDSAEREFRGFGRVEQTDVEDFSVFAAGNSASPYITDDHTLYQPPVKTITWFHTGAFVDRERILSQFQREYFAPESASFAENALPQPDLAALHLSPEEWREALRACKGMTLRQEIYELDVDALAQGEEQRVKLFSTAYHNCHIQCLQPRSANRHAVFLATESEAITYHYELDLRSASLPTDPRIAHTLNLRTDEYGNVLESVAIAYPRIGQHTDATLPAGAEALIAQVQHERHLAYTENRFTNDVIGVDHYRLRLPCEVKSYELTGIAPTSGFYYTLAELRAANLGTGIPEIPYHRLNDGTRQKRLVEWARTLFFNDDLQTPLPLNQLNALGLPYETYKLALTAELLRAVFAEKLDDDEAQARLADAQTSGYLSGADLASRFSGVDTTGQYWIRSGVAGFAEGAAQHFYLPERYTDPFGNITTLEYDTNYDLYIRSSTDPLGNRTEVTRFDYRVLAPIELQDINGNRSEVYFDVLGLPAAMASKGKGSEGDNLSGFSDVLAHPTHAELSAFFIDNPYNETQARTWLGNATARHVYYFGGTHNPDGSVTWGTHPACACGIVRERHVSQLGADEQSPLQAGFEYSDGGGNVLVKKVPAEPESAGGALRWIANGKTVLNNKGKPVKQYEPYFSDSGHRFEEPREEGVTPILYYDAAGRLVRTELPDGSFSWVEFSPWYAASYDPNDTVTDSQWYATRSPPDPHQPLPRHPITLAINVSPDQRAAWLAAQHANTPALSFLDSLGREVISVAHNRYRDADELLHDEKFVTFTKLDAEGKPLWIRDARGNLVMQYVFPPKPNDDPSNGLSADTVPCYDITGNLLFQHSMDAGDRWMLMDAAGKPMLAWDVNETPQGATTTRENRLYTTDYDALHRPVGQWLRINTQPALLVERFEYGESHPQAEARNLRGQAHRHYDPSGLVSNERFDFKGNLLEATRRLASAYDAPVVDWSEGSPTARLEVETYTQRTEYDALNRMTRLYNWHLEGRVPAVYTPQYNERGALKSEVLSVRGQPPTDAVLNIEYDAKGQRVRIQYGNGTTTRYYYDPLTFRLRQLRTTRPTVDLPFPQHRADLNDARVLQQLLYTYDPVGNITEIHDDAYEPVFFNNQQVEPRNRYTYDALYRLIEATGRENYHATDAPGQIEAAALPVTFQVTDQALRNYAQRYTYDSVGNFIEMRHSAARGSWTRHYETAPDSNRLQRTWLGSDASNAVRYDYDTHGSMLNLNRTPEEYRLRWDYRDMIHTANLGGGGQAFYNYDAGKQRTRKRIEQLGGTVEERLYLGGMELYRRYAPSGNLVEQIETHHLFVDDQRVLLVDDVIDTNNPQLGEGVLMRYQHGNHLGSVALELDETAQIVGCEEFHPYGTTAYHLVGHGVRATAKRYRYTGMERDEESGLSYHTARYYAPWLGRWGSADPIGLEGGPNYYAYAAGNPLGRIDRNGRQPTRSQLYLYESPAFRTDITATFAGRGISSELRVRMTGVYRMWTGDYASSVDVGHVGTPFVLLCAGTVSQCAPELSAENRAWGATRDRAAAAEARSLGLFARTGGSDLTAAGISSRGTRHAPNPLSPGVSDSIYITAGSATTAPQRMTFTAPGVLYGPTVAPRLDDVVETPMQQLSVDFDAPVPPAVPPPSPEAPPAASTPEPPPPAALMTSTRSSSGGGSRRRARSGSGGSSSLPVSGSGSRGAVGGAIGRTVDYVDEIEEGLLALTRAAQAAGSPAAAAFFARGAAAVPVVAGAGLAGAGVGHATRVSLDAVGVDGPTSDAAGLFASVVMGGYLGSPLGVPGLVVGGILGGIFYLGSR